MQNTKVRESSRKGVKVQLPKYYLNPHQDTEKTYEKPKGKKLTIADQSMTVKEILTRHTHGMRTPDQMVGYYDDDNDPLGLEGTNIETLDLSQKYELLDAVRRKTRRMRNDFEKQENDKKLSKLKESITKELSEKQNPPQPIVP